MAKKQSGKMFESKFNEELLTQLIEEGKSADEIQDALGIVSKQSLRQHILKWMNIHRTFVDVPGLYTRNSPTPQISFKKELRLSKNMLAPGKFKHGDKFEIEEMTNARIVLARIGAEVPVEDSSEEVEADPEAEFDLG